jgi:hypothetical protein
MFRWPNEFDRLDGGGLWIRPDLAKCFAQAGWMSTAAILGSDLVRYTRLRSYFNGWDTGTASLPSTSGASLVLHVKRFRPGWRGLSRGMREAHTIGLFESAGIACMRIAAVGAASWRGRVGPHCSFFISEQVGTGESAYSLLQQWRPDDADAEVARRREWVVGCVAESVARMHARDLYHGDLKWKHLLPDPDWDRVETWRLIDLERACRATGPAAMNAWITDLWKAGRSMDQLGLSAAERELWSVTYERVYNEDGGRFRRLAALRDRAVAWRTLLIDVRRPLVRLLQPARRHTTRLPTG